MSRNFDFSQAASKGVTVLPDLTATPPIVGDMVSVKSVTGGGQALLGFTTPGQSTAIVSDTPPPSAADGALWYDSVGTGLYIRYNDGSSTQWVVAENQNTLLDANPDGQTYGRRNGAWVNLGLSYLQLAGGNLSGPLVLAADPSAPLGAATRQYVDNAVFGSVVSFNGRHGAVVLSSTDVTAALTFSPYNAANPAGYQTAAQLTAALVPYAPLASPVLTGAPVAPTATAGTANSQLATTQFVATAVPVASATLPLMNAAAAIGVGTTWARADHVHPTDTSRYAVTNPAGYVSAIGASAAAPVQSVAGRAGAVALTHTDITDWTATLAPYALASSVPLASSTTPVMDGAAAIGSGTTWAKADHRHPSDTSLLALTGGVMSGALTINSHDEWSSDLFGSQLIIQATGFANPGLGIADSTGANYVGIFNWGGAGGTLTFAGMPPPGDHTSPPALWFYVSSTAFNLLVPLAMPNLINAANDAAAAAAGVPLHTFYLNGNNVQVRVT